MSDDEDYRYALELQKKLNNEVSTGESLDHSVELLDYKSSKKMPKVPIKRSNPHSNLDSDFLNRTQNLVHPQWETLDPTPDVHSLFRAFDDKFFQARLKCVTLEWSKRMYSCAGICYSRSNRFGMDITVRLSEPLLKLRPRKDLIETMLHEMIHAYCFVLHIREGNGGHGPQFKKIMCAINKVAGTNISVYHSFHDEVEVYKQHWWRCNGSCQNRSPFFGYVKRTCNRAPGSNDQWWAAHQESCGGTFMKIKGPDKTKSIKPKAIKNPIIANGNDMRKYLTNSNNNNSNHGNTNTSKASSSNTKPFISFTKGNVKTNGGGTIMLNPTIAKSFPPTSYPGLSTDPFNTGAQNTKKYNNNNNSISTSGTVLNNVRSFRDLDAALNTNTNTNHNSLEGEGYTLTASNNGNPLSKKSTNGEVDRNHLREIWSKRFEKTNQQIEKANDAKKRSATEPICINDDVNDENYGNGFREKRKKENEDSVIIENKIIDLSDTEMESEIKNKKHGNLGRESWVLIDEEIMLRDQPNDIITLSSSDEDEEDNRDDDFNEIKTPNAKKAKPLTQEQRQNAIKQEIMDESVDLNNDDIVLIDDEYDDNAEDISAAVELADTSIIDEFFGEDTLLKEFRDENDVRPMSSRYVANPANDIITCPICQGKMQRNLFANHLDGCTGIAIRIKPSTKAFHRNQTNSSRDIKRTRKSRKSTKDLLRQAGYTEKDLADITASNTEDESTTSDMSVIDVSLTSSSPINSGSGGEENNRRHRQRSLYKTTVQCPNCGTEQQDINEHLDECLSQ